MWKQLKYYNLFCRYVIVLLAVKIWKKTFSDRNEYTYSSLFCMSYIMTTFEWGKKDFIDQKAKVSENQEQVLSDEQKKEQQEKQQQALKSAKEATKKEAEKSAQELPNLNNAYDEIEWKKVEKWNDDIQNAIDRFTQDIVNNYPNTMSVNSIDDFLSKFKISSFVI